MVKPSQQSITSFSTVIVSSEHSPVQLHTKLNYAYIMDGEERERERVREQFCKISMSKNISNVLTGIH